MEETIAMQEKIDRLEKEHRQMHEELEVARKRIDSLEKHATATAALLQESNDTLRFLTRQKRLEDHSKSDFLANMSHEIRTPLNIILGMAHLLAETPLTTAQRQYLNSLRLTGRQLMEILNNVLEFSRIKAGKIDFASEPFSLQKIIDQLEASALPLCLPKRLEFVVMHDPLLVMERVGDSLKIFQILLNLVNNAVKFTQTGTITLSIEEDKDQEKNLILSVEDTGIGITREQQKDIFARFTQATNPLSEQHRGVGLGLTISQKLTEAMGGDLSVTSYVGEGSTFSCRLPLPELNASERSEISLTTRPILPETFHRLRILAVDDIKENLELLQVFLKDYPVEICVAYNGLEALQQLDARTFDVILMDIRMPVMDGITATSAIREKEKGSDIHAIILAITAHAFQEQKKKFLQLGFDGVLTKPFTKRDLIEVLFTCTGAKKADLPPAEMGNKAIGYCLEKERVEEIPEKLTDLIPDIFQSIATDLDIIKKGLSNQEYALIDRTCHALKGVCGMFGFRHLATLIADLSDNVKARNYSIVEDLIISLELYLAQLQNPAQTPAISGSDTYAQDEVPPSSSQHMDD